MITRNECLKLGALGAAFAAAGRLPVLAKIESSHPYPISDYASYVNGFEPVGRAGASTPREYIYDYLHWGFGGSMAESRGQLRIVRESATSYRCELNFAGVKGKHGNIRAAFQLRSKGVGLQQWSTDFEYPPTHEEMRPMASYTEVGRAYRNGFQIGSLDTDATYTEVAAPLFPDWLLPVLLPNILGNGTQHFALLREASFVLNGQTLIDDGSVSITVASGKDVPLKNILHTGDGTMPTNYLIDANGLTQLVTYGVVAFALQSVQA